MFLAVSGLSPCLLHKPMCSALQKKATFPQMLDILQLFVDPVVVQCSRTTNKHIQIYLTSLVSAVGF